MADNDIALMAHLMRRAGFGATRDDLEAYCAKGYEATVEMRRAGFGATRDDLEAYCAKGYEATVEELLHPEDQPHRVRPDVSVPA